jgi:flagellar biosynthesis GTPase FlhF
MTALPVAEGGQVGVGFSHQTLLTASVVGFVGVAVVVYALIVSRVKSHLDDDDDDAPYEAKLARADVAQLTRAQRRARAHLLMKQQRKAPVVTNNDDNNSNILVDDTNPEPQPALLSRKERQKAAKAAEREERQRYQEERQKQHEQSQKEAALERGRRHEQAAQHAAEIQARQQTERILQQQKEEEEKQIFLSSPEKTWLVEEWWRSVQKQRRVDLVALGAEFHTSSCAVHQRIQQLLVEQRVTGILESKQFIVLSENELQSIADQIREKGAVTLRDVVELCAPIIAS